jgi:hypothetical protein
MFLRISNHDATPSELRLSSNGIPYPGFQSKPWAGIGERFQRLVTRLEARAPRGALGIKQLHNIDSLHFEL